MLPIPRVIVPCLLVALAGVVASAQPAAEAGSVVDAARVTIILDSDFDLVHHVLRERILPRSRVSVEVTRNESDPSDLRIYLGWIGGADTRLSQLARDHGVELPTVKIPDAPHPAAEGFAIKTVRVDGVPSVIVVAQEGDKRGLLYGAGELLRRLTYGPDRVSLGELDLQMAPAYRLRGSSANQGGTMRQITGARGWTTEETWGYMIDLALSGANVLYAWGEDFDYIKAFDLMGVGGCRPNQYDSEYPEEWKAGGLEGWEGTNWVCPSIPEARKALMEQWEREFSTAKHHDVLRFYAGDPGGCRCERCEPWGKTFILLCEELAALWHKYHPNSMVQIANQDLSNEGDIAIFDYLNEEPRLWLEGIAYGPGSNAMSSYFRDELREDLFEHAGSGPVNRYLKEILHNIPKYQQISHYSDITHWISAQYMVENPEPHIVKLYGRRTFHTRPAAFYRIFQAIMPFSEGDIIYSEGYHDEFHQFMWNRLLWNPNRSLEDVMAEYGRYFFGAEAEPLMSEAMLQLEKNLEAPLAENEGIDRYYQLVKEAGTKIPPNLMAIDHRWRLHMQKAALDKYFQLKLRREREREAALEALAKGDPERAVTEGQALIQEPIETPEMAALKEEARRLGEETDKLFGQRVNGYFSIDKPMTALGWTEKQFEIAAQASEAERRAMLERLASYEDPGPGGFYDDAGNRQRQPHLVKGNSYDATAFMDPNNRPSQNTIAYSMDDPRGVAFRYEGLDPAAAYKVRVTMAMPRARRMMANVPPDLKRTQSILADGEYIARNVEIPEFTAEHFEYDVPPAATADGALELTFERGDGSMGVVVSEVWLLRR
jgi:hypothetical protein